MKATDVSSISKAKGDIFWCHLWAQTSENVIMDLNTMKRHIRIDSHLNLETEMTACAKLRFGGSGSWRPYKGSKEEKFREKKMMGSISKDVMSPHELSFSVISSYFTITGGNTHLIHLEAHYQWSVWCSWLYLIITPFRYLNAGQHPFHSLLQYSLVLWT